MKHQLFSRLTSAPSDCKNDLMKMYIAIDSMSLKDSECLTFLCVDPTQLSFYKLSKSSCPRTGMHSAKITFMSSSRDDSGTPLKNVIPSHWQ